MSTTGSHDHDHDGHSDSDHDTLGATQGTTVGAAGRPPPRKRNRAALSCTLCRERKVKCDRIIPCTQCIKRGDEAFCHLDPNKKGPPPKLSAAAKAAAAAAQAQAAQAQQQQAVRPSGSAIARPAPMQHVSSGGHSSSAGDERSPNTDSDEVAAIKARLAQLETVLATRGGSIDSMQSQPPFDTRFTFQAQSMYSNSNSGASSSASPAANFNSPPFTTSRSSNSGPSFYASPPSTTAHGAQSATFPSLFSRPDGVARLPPLITTSPNSGMGFGPFDPRFGRSQSVASSTGTNGRAASRSDDHGSISSRTGGGERDMIIHTKHEVDSDTEDAALVLEGLAMGAPGVRGEKCPDAKPSAVKHPKCPDENDVIRRAPRKGIQDFVDADRTTDIMTVSAALGPSDEEMVSACPNAGKVSDADVETVGGKCPTSIDDDLPIGATVDRDGKPLSPARIVCRLLLSHQHSLMRLINGPETHLGWGLGWAFAAAEAAGDMASVNEVKGCPGALQREAILRAIIRSLPSKEVADHLVNVFSDRVKQMTGNVIHMPSFRKEVDALYALETIEKRARVVNFVDPGWLAQLLMVFVLALHFHPCEPKAPDLVMHLFDGRTVHLWRSAAQTALVLARYQSSSSMAVLVAIILINLHASGTGRENYSLMQTAITNAKEMGLHKLGNKDRQPRSGENTGITIRREMAKRIWATLVFNDWCSASYCSGAYSVHRAHFNTPPPLNLNDEDLLITPTPAEHPPQVHTEMSFFLVKYKLMDIVRENVDLMNKREREGRKLTCEDTAYLDSKYRGLLENAEEWYRIGSEVGAGTDLEVERWLLQQSVFHRLLRLHRPNLSSRATSRNSCVLLARSILDMQRRIRARCSVVDRLFWNLSQSFSAAIVLCLDLLQSRPPATMRTIVRSEIGEAVKALRHVTSSNVATDRSIRVIEALLDEEETRWQAGADNSDVAGPTAQKRKRDANGKDRKKSLLNLALRVARAANGETAPGEDTEMSCSQTPAAATTNAATPGSFPWQEDMQNAKDARSRELMEQLFQGRPGATDDLASFNNFPPQQNFLDQQYTVNNGLDFLPLTPPETDSFDITKFLAEYDSPPSDAQSGSPANHEQRQGIQHAHSSGSIGTAQSNASSNGFGGGNLSGVPSPQTSMSDAARSSSHSAHANSPSQPPETSVTDALWAWMLAQGSRPAADAASPAYQQPLGQPQWQPAPGPQINGGLTGPPPASIADWSGVAASNTSQQQQQPQTSAALAAPSPSAFASYLANAANISAVMNESTGGAAAPGTSAAPVSTPSASAWNYLAYDPSLTVQAPNSSTAWMSTPGAWEFAQM